VVSVDAKDFREPREALQSGTTEESHCRIRLREYQPEFIIG